MIPRPFNMSPYLIALVALVAPLMARDEAPIRLILEDRVTGQISPGLFGQFVELLRPGNAEAAGDAAIDPTTGDFRPDVRAVLDQLDLPVLRYPGGAIVETPAWRWTQLIDGADTLTGEDKDKRVNAFGLHRFLDWSAEIHARPILVVKLADIARGIIPAAEVIDQARGMLAYVNGRDNDALPADLRRWPRLRAANGHPEPWVIRDWQIGNEFTWVAVERLRRQGLDREAISKAYVDAVGQIHKAMRALDPNIQFLVEIDMEQTRTDIPVAEALHAKLHGDIAGMTAHKYFCWGIDTLQKDGVDQPLLAMNAEIFWSAVVSAPGTDERGQARLNLPMLHTANRLGYPLAITEWNWNSWWNLPGADNASAPNNLWTKGVAAASMLHGMMNAPGRISLATQSMLVGTDWDIRAVDAKATPARCHPSGQVTSLYSHYHGSDRLAWSSAKPIPSYSQPWKVGQLEPNPNVAILDCVVTRGAKNVYIHLINRQHTQSQRIEIDTQALVAETVLKAEVHQLCAGEQSPTAQLSSHTVIRDSSFWSIDLPSGSVQILCIPKSHQD